MKNRDNAYKSCLNKNKRVRTKKRNRRIKSLRNVVSAVKNLMEVLTFTVVTVTIIECVLNVFGARITFKENMIGQLKMKAKTSDSITIQFMIT